MFRKCECTPRSLSARLLPDSIVIPAVLLAALVTACGGGGDGGGGGTSNPQTGTIGNLAFTVTSGSITQGAPNGPVTVGANGAMLLFDEPISILSMVPGMVNMMATVQLLNGGSATGIAFGGTTLPITGGFGATIQRSDPNFNYELLYLTSGVPTSETGAYPTSPNAPGDPVFLTADFHNSIPILGYYEVVLWYLDVTSPNACSFPLVQIYSVGTPDGGAGDRIGLYLKDATLSDILIRDPIETGC